ncbi:MAG: hypothetical protein V4501_11120 [Pseudomonadota bacterium]
MDMEDLMKGLFAKSPQSEYRGSIGGPLRHLDKDDIKDIQKAIEILQSLDRCKSSHAMLVRHVIPMAISPTEFVVKGTLEINFFTKLNLAQVDNAMKKDGDFCDVLRNVLKHVTQNDNYLDAQEEMAKAKVDGELQ